MASTDGPWVRFFPSDWLGGTRGMSAAETGVYITLVCLMYERMEPVDRDDNRQARLCGVPLATYRKILDTLIDEGKVTLEAGGLWNNRVAVELQNRVEISDAARKKANARWEKTEQKQGQENAGAMPKQSAGNANHNHNHKDTSNDVSAPQAASKRSRGTRLDADWKLPQTYGNWALEQGLPRERILIEANKMRDWSINAGAKGAKVDWFAAWRNWVQKAIDELPANKAANGFQKPARGVSALADRIRRDIENGAGQDGARGADGEAVQRLPFFADEHH